MKDVKFVYVVVRSASSLASVSVGPPCGGARSRGRGCGAETEWAECWAGRVCRLSTRRHATRGGIEYIHLKQSN
jgi:hypothetical protein